MATYQRFQGSARCGEDVASGYALITDQADCTAAGRALGLLQSSQQATFGAYTQSKPGGCFVIGAVSVSFNANAASSGAGDVLCRLAAAASPPPPPPDVAASDDDGESFPVWAILLIVVGVLLALLALASVLWRSRRNRQVAPLPRAPAPPPPRRYPPNRRADPRLRYERFPPLSPPPPPRRFSPSRV
jgi:hypothetical protein